MLAPFPPLKLLGAGPPCPPLPTPVYHGADCLKNNRIIFLSQLKLFQLNTASETFSREATLLSFNFASHLGDCHLLICTVGKPSFMEGKEENKKSQKLFPFVKNMESYPHAFK